MEHGAAGIGGTGVNVTVVHVVWRHVFTRVGGDLLPMVKPQFEVGRDRVGAGGVVRDPALRHEAVLGVVRSAAEVGLRTEGCVASPLPGPSGNVEFFLWLRRGVATIGADDIDAVVSASRPSR